MLRPYYDMQKKITDVFAGVQDEKANMLFAEIVRQ